MRPYRGLLLLLALATLGALAWHLLADDPGYLLLSIRGWSIETTVVAAVLGVLLVVAALYATIGLLLAPLRWWRRGRRRSAREQLGNGLLALHEGRWLRAEKALRRAAADRSLRLPALLYASEATRQRGDPVQADALLAEALRGEANALAAIPTLQRLLADGRAASACELLDGIAQRDALPPRVLELKALALAGCGRSEEAAALLPQLRREKVREGDAWHTLEHSILIAWLRDAGDSAELQRRWTSLERAQRLRAPLVAAFASRAAQIGDDDDGAAAIERCLTKSDWNADLVRLYGALRHGDQGRALRTAEAWLASRPDDPDALLCLGRLCRRDQLWGKAEAYLVRALALGAGAAAWEALAGVYADQGDDARARQAYVNALETPRGGSARPLLRLQKPTDDPAVAEERSSMGVPRLPAAGQPGIRTL